MKALAAAVGMVILWSLAARGADVPPAAAAGAAAQVYPTAILTFEERGDGVKGYGAKVSDILFASLVARPELFLVDRQDLKKILDEQEVNLSGMVSPDQAVKVGKLTGAKVLVTGSIVEADKSLYLVAKIIGSETSRVLGESVKGKLSDDIGTLAEALAGKIATMIGREADKLVAKEVKMEDRIAALNKVLGAAKRPTLLIRVAERHVGQATMDPAAETELTLFAKETGFEVIDPKTGNSKQADVIIEGEGFSEFGMRRENIISVKARVEIKATDRTTDQVIAADRQTAVEVDLTEQIAGKKALQTAAATIAERLLPKLVRR